MTSMSVWMGVLGFTKYQRASRGILRCGFLRRSEEKRQVRKSQRTDNLELVYKFGQQEHAQIPGLTASGKKLFGARLGL